MPSAHSVALLVLLFATLLSAGLKATEPRYTLDHAFKTPVLTERINPQRTAVLADDSFFVFGGSAPASHRTYARRNGELTGNLIRFHPDGSVDSTFQLDRRLLSYSVTALAQSADGKFLVACTPAPAAPSGNNKVFRLNADGSIDPTFDAGSGTVPGRDGNPYIYTIVVDREGRLLIAGRFGDFSGHGRTALLRLQSDGTLDSSFAAVRFVNDNTQAALGIISDTGIALQEDGRIVIVGAFTSVNESPRLFAARLHEDGTLDTGFVPSGYDPRTSAYSQTKYPINSVAAQPGDGKIVLGGSFNPSFQGQQTLVRLHPDGSIDSSFSATRSNNVCNTLRLQSDGKVLSAEARLARYDSNGSLDTAFKNAAPLAMNGPSLSTVRHVTVQSSGHGIFAGPFTTVGGNTHSGVARVHANGTYDSAFNIGELEREHLPYGMDRRTDGRILVSGSFDRVNGTPRKKLALLEADGSLSDVQFLHSFYYVSAVLLPDDKTLLFGWRENDYAFYYRRMFPDGTPDGSLVADPEIGEFASVHLQSDGGYLLSTGSYLSGVISQRLLSHLKPDGTVNTGFTLGVPSENLVQRDPATRLIRHMIAGDNSALLVLPDDKILFKYFDGEYKIVRLHSDGSLDKTFQIGNAAPRSVRLTYPLVHDPVTGTTIQPQDGVLQPSSRGPMVALRESDGGILLAGQFTSYNGVAAGGIVRLNEDGSVNSTFGSGAEFAAAPITSVREPSITSVEPDYSGRMLVAGDFETFHGVPAAGLVRLNADGSVDKTFVAPVAQLEFGPERTPWSILVRERAGSFLLAGNYSADGDAADVSIVRLEIPVRAAAMERTAGNTLQMMFQGVPGEHYSIESSTNPAATTFGGATPPVQANANGIFVYEDTAAFGSLQRFYRAVSLD